MEAIPYVLAAISVLSALVCVGSAVWAGRTWPVQIRRDHLTMGEAVARASSDAAAALDAAERLHRQQVEWIEQADGILDAVETKRRRIAARESKANNSAPPEDPRMSLLNRARSMGVQI